MGCKNVWNACIVFSHYTLSMRDPLCEYWHFLLFMAEWYSTEWESQGLNTALFTHVFSLSPCICSCCSCCWALGSSHTLVWTSYPGDFQTLDKIILSTQGTPPHSPVFSTLRGAPWEWVCCPLMILSLADINESCLNYEEYFILHLTSSNAPNIESIPVGSWKFEECVLKSMSHQMHLLRLLCQPLLVFVPSSSLPTRHPCPLTTQRYRKELKQLSIMIQCNKIRIQMNY